MKKEDFFNLLAEIFVERQIVCANDVFCLADKLLNKELKEKFQSKEG